MLTCDRCSYALPCWKNEYSGVRKHIHRGQYGTPLHLATRPALHDINPPTTIAGALFPNKPIRRSRGACTKQNNGTWSLPQQKRATLHQLSHTAAAGEAARHSCAILAQELLCPPTAGSVAGVFWLATPAHPHRLLFSSTRPWPSNRFSAAARLVGVDWLALTRPDGGAWLVDDGLACHPGTHHAHAQVIQGSLYRPQTTMLQPGSTCS